MDFGENAFHKVERKKAEQKQIKWISSILFVLDGSSLFRAVSEDVSY